MDYDAWKTGLYEDVTPGSGVNDELEELKHNCKEWLEGIMECVYGPGDLKDIDWYFEELCAYLEVEFKGDNLKVERRRD